MSLNKKMKEILNRKMIGALIYVVLGIALVLLRDRAPVYLCMAVGVGMGIVGIYGLIYHIVREEVLLGLPLDVLLIVGGIILSFCASFVSVILATLLGVFMIIESVFRLQSSLIAKKMHSKAWIVDFVYSILTMIMGILLVINPLRGTGYLALAMGIIFIADGILGLVAHLITIKVDPDTEPNHDFVVEAEVVEQKDADEK